MLKGCFRRFAAHNPLAIPIYLSTLSAGILLVHTVWKWFASRKSDATKVEGRNVVRAAGGFVIYGFRILRLFAVAALLAMQVLVLLHGKHDGGVAKKVLLYGLCGVYVSGSTSKICSSSTKPVLRRILLSSPFCQLQLLLALHSLPFDTCVSYWSLHWVSLYTETCGLLRRTRCSLRTHSMEYSYGCTWVS